MTENENSPENLRKFLENDDPAMVMMGLSMAKGSDVPEDLLVGILWMYMLHDDKTIRAAAKSTFIKLAPEDAKQAVKENWKAIYRKDKYALSEWIIFRRQLSKLEKALCQTSLNNPMQLTQLELREKMEEYKIKDLLIEWLVQTGMWGTTTTSEQEHRLEIINDINNSTIGKKGTEITITYDNGGKYIVEINHLNTSRPTLSMGRESHPSQQLLHYVNNPETPWQPSAKRSKRWKL